MNNTADIGIRKMGGCSGALRSKSEGSTAFLFYFMPDTNGAAYVIVTRPEAYQSFSSVKVTFTGSTQGAQSSSSMDSYLHKFRFTGLTAGRTYNIRMSYYSGTTEAEYTEIQRTYYGSNVTPSNNPYADTYGTITVPSYTSSYPKYCVDIDCSENNSKQDGRCPYDYQTRNLFWQVCATNYETHPIASAMESQNTCRWHRGTVYVSVSYQSNTNKAAVSARINEWIIWMNGIMNEVNSGVTFRLGSTTANNGMQISVIVGTHQQLWGYNPDNTSSETWVYGGTCESIYWGDGILESRVKICCESRYPFNYCSTLFQGVVFEELTEASGPRYDQFAINNTVFCEIAYPGKTIGGPPGESWERDENVIKILYSLGYLKGYTNSSYGPYSSEYGSGITFTDHYNSYGALSSSSINLFFQINASSGSVVQNTDLPATLHPSFKNKRTYTMQAIYATEVPTTHKEESSGLSFRYTNFSAEGYPYFDLPNNPSYSSTKRVNGGYKINVSGLSVSGEYYYFRAYLKDVTDVDIEDYTYYEYTSANYSASSMSLTNLKYGRPYDFYLYSSYYAQSDWVYVGEGTVAPMLPALSNTSHTASTVTFTYSMSGTEFDYVMALLYKDGVLVATNNYSSDSKTATLSFTEADGNYELRVYSLKNANGTAIQCVNSSGNNNYASYTFTISNRSYFYWGNYTDEMTSGGTVRNISYIVWNAFVQNVYDTVLTYAHKNGNMPSNSSTYKSGFGDASACSYSVALNTYAKMSSSESALTAERFNIVNYIISLANNTGLSYKYSKATSPTKVYASELITLQNKLNSI